MAIVAFFNDIRNCTTEQYYEVLTRLAQAGADPPKGQLYHVMYMKDGAPHVIDVYDTPENLQAFGELLAPILADMGIEAGPPVVVEAENTMAG